MLKKISHHGFRLSTLSLIAFLASCQTIDNPAVTDPDPADPVDGGSVTVQFTRDINVSAMEDAIDPQGVRVEIALQPEGLIADEVVVESHDDVADDEVIRSTIAGLSVTEDGNTLTLALGELAVGFPADAVFRGLEGGEMTFEEFVDEVTNALDANMALGVEARRPAPSEPQGPDDNTFDAGMLMLLEEVEAPSIEMNIDRDNVSRNSAPPPDGYITVLALPIELWVSDGITKIKLERRDLDIRRFNDLVASVDVGESTVTLHDGTTVRVVDRSRVKPESVGNRRLSTLERVAEALEAGIAVRAKGKGVVESEDPLVLVAIKIAFRPDFLGVQRFYGEVTAVDLDAGTFTIGEETVVHVVDHTVILHRPWHTDHPTTLAAVARALEEGLKVSAKGVGFLNQDDPAVFIAIVVKFEFEKPDGEEHEKFAGFVAAVDLEGGTFTLEDGTVVEVGNTSEVHFTLDNGPVPHHNSLDDVAEALDLGLTVHAEGVGIVVGTEPLTIRALRLAFELHVEDPYRFHGIVGGVDLETGYLTLLDGTVVGVIGLTRIDPMWLYDFHIVTAEVIARAIEAGIAVTVAGEGQVIGEDPLTIIASRIEFGLGFTALVEFEDRVTAVDLDDQTFTLADGMVVSVVDGTKIGSPENEFPDLEAVAAALGDEVAIVARGVGALQAVEPVTVVGLKVEFRRE